MTEPLRIFIGYDAREDEAYRVCEASIRKHASVPVLIEPLMLPLLRRIGFYRRGFVVDGGQKWDEIDRKPFSTDFSFSRFLVPVLTMRRGMAMFVDCDFMFRADVAELFAAIDPSVPLSCVHHNYRPNNVLKMDNVLQTVYSRKNWSSLMVFNCAHPAHDNLTIDAVNTKPGSWLHGLQWVSDEYQIGAISEEWNWLDGHSAPMDVKAVHWTNGGPWFKAFENVAFADEYRSYL